MIHILNRAVLLLTILLTSSFMVSCEDDSKGWHHDDLYLVTSNQIVDYYFKPKKLFTYSWKTRISGNWFFNNNAGNNEVTLNEQFDKNQEYAEHYYFLNEDDLQKYKKSGESIDGEILLEDNDIMNPYKDYSLLFEDYGHITDHDYMAINSGIQACVLSVTAIDVICNKDFDQSHPAGSNLNDILKYNQDFDTYTFLHSPENKGKDIHSGLNWITKFEPRKLSDIPNNPIYMMNRAYEISFDHEPTTPGTYEFTVKFTFGADPLTGETVDIAPATVSIDF